VIRFVLSEHAGLAVDPNAVAGTDDPSPAGNGSWWAKKRMMTGSPRRVLAMRRRSTARSTIRHDQHVARPSRGRLGLCGFDRRFDIREFGFDGSDHDLFLGVELVVDGRLRHADSVSDYCSDLTPTAYSANRSSQALTIFAFVGLSGTRLDAMALVTSAELTPG
jgi:hypothetical protein